MTGYTTRMFGSQKIKGDYITFSYLLEDILKSMGHTVDRRKVDVKEKFLSNDYDFAFCGVAPLGSIGSAHVVETHHVLDTMTGRCAVYADDWSFCGYGTSIKRMLNRWPQYLAYKKFPYDRLIIEKTKKSLELMISVTDEGNNAPVLAPMFPWGDHKFLMNGNYLAKLWTVDPSKWVRFPTVDISEPKDRKRQWVMAALSDHSRWIDKQKFKLPIKHVGNKQVIDSKLLSENDTVRLFASSFGVLSCGYPSAGSGWWRTRYLNAAWAEAIVYSDPRDAEIMGIPYRGTAEFFENIVSEFEYLEIASAQASWLNSHISDPQVTMSIMERLMKK
jgi:hypothetical protein